MTAAPGPALLLLLGGALVASGAAFSPATRPGSDSAAPPLLAVGAPLPADRPQPLRSEALPLADQPPLHADGPPLGHTGAFGEPSCVACHFGMEVNPPGGRVRIEGAPEKYDAERTYVLTVVLESEQMGAAGFQLSVRSADGAMGGELRPTSSRVAVRDSAGLAYAQHTRAGSRVENPDIARWQVTWTPVRGAHGPVTLAVAANSANGDDSPFSDYVYTAQVSVPAPSSASDVSPRP